MLVEEKYYPLCITHMNSIRVASWQIYVGNRNKIQKCFRGFVVNWIKFVSVCNLEFCMKVEMIIRLSVYLVLWWFICQTIIQSTTHSLYNPTNEMSNNSLNYHKLFYQQILFIYNFFSLFKNNTQYVSRWSHTRHYLSCETHHLQNLITNITTINFLIHTNIFQVIVHIDHSSYKALKHQNKLFGLHISKYIIECVRVCLLKLIKQ